MIKKKREIINYNNTYIKFILKKKMKNETNDLENKTKKICGF